MRTLLIRTGAALALMLGCIAISAAPASAEIGNDVNVEEYCQWAYGNDFHADLVDHNAYGWMCNPAPGKENAYRDAWRKYNMWAVDMKAQCNFQGYLEADYLDYYDPYSWYCMR